jgi:hypothetical protein
MPAIKDETTPGMIESAFADGQLNNCISESTHDPWAGTWLAKYVHMTSKKKGVFGEKFVQKIMEFLGHKVYRPTNVGHDRIIGDIKTEIKFAVTCRDRRNNSVFENKFMLNHIATLKDWDRLIFCGIDCHLRPNIVWFTKEEFITNITFFSHQQGGNKAANDDYMHSNAKKLFGQSWVHDISKW